MKRFTVKKKIVVLFLAAAALFALVGAVRHGFRKKKIQY